MIESVISFAHDALHAQLDAGIWRESSGLIRTLSANLPTAKVLGPVDVSRLPTSAAEIERILSTPIECTAGWSVVVTGGLGDAAMVLVAVSRIDDDRQTSVLLVPITITDGEVSVAYSGEVVWDGSDAFPEFTARDLTGLIHTLPDDLKGEVSDPIWQNAVTALLATAAAFGRTA